MEQKGSVLEEVKAMFAETNQSIKALEQVLMAMFAKTEKLIDGLGATNAETEKLINRIGTKVTDVNVRVEGIAKSNGKFAEELFFYSLYERKTISGIHFDDVSDGFKRLLKLPDGTRLQDQFDVVMTNDTAVAIVEIKYKADSDDVEELVGKKVRNFRILFPDFKDYDIYLGLGSLSFDEYVAKKAEGYGIALLRQVGDTIEYSNDWAIKKY